MTYGTPVRGTGSVTTGSTASANPGGGGTINALLSGSSPVNKLSVLKAFGGGTVLSVIESARTRTMYAAVESPSGTHQLWQWSASYLNPTLFWTASSGESIVKIAGFRDGDNRQAQGMVTNRSSGRRVYVWGSNAGYWTGRGTNSGSTATPTELTSLRDLGVRDIAVGYLSMAVADGDGDVWVWGTDSHGQLGLASTTGSTTPVEITASNVAGGGSPPSNVLEIDMSALAVYARTSTQVISWGYNTTYVGHATSTTPAAVTLTSCTPVTVSAGMYYSGSSGYPSTYVGCSEGGARSWGYNTYGQLGDNSTTTRTSPVSVSGLPSGVAVSQVEGGAGAGFARLSDGRVYGWGSNLYRQLGITTNYSSAAATYKTAQEATRVVMPGSVTLSSIWATEWTAGAVGNDGVMRTWGNAAWGLLGRGTKGPSANTTGAAYDRIGVVDGTGVELIDSTDRGTVMVMSDDSVWTWGYNDINTWNNGDGGSGSRLWPGKIELPFGPGTAYPNETIERLACGTNHCLVATSDGRIFGWGDQTYKQVLPTAATAVNSYNTPTLVADLASVPRIAAGRYFSLYVEPGSSGGTVYGWGYNSNRAAAPNGTVINALTAFTAVSAYTDVVDVSAGWYHSSVLRADGTVATWGSNGGYEFGNATKTNVAPYYAAVALPAGQTVVSVHAAGRATFARTAAGKLYAWGTNYYGFLGTGATSTLTTPASVATTITSDADIIAFDVFISQVTTSVFYTALAVAIDETGQVWSWGANYYGQLGADIAAATSGASSYKSTPQRVKTSAGAQLAAGARPVAGAGWGATYSPVTSGQAPSEPQSVSATAGNGQVSVSWSAPASPRDLRTYTVIARNATSSAIVAQVGAASSATSATITGLTNGTEYSFTVAATNEYGTSAESSPAATATPVSVPTVPLELVATPGTDSISASWSAPASSGGSAVIDYTATLTPTGGGSASTSTVSTTSTSFTGLTAGTSYSLAVTARNTQGSSLAATQTVVIVGRPTVPLNVTASARLASALVTWSAPASDGGAPIASYYVRAYSTGTTSLQASAVVTSGTTTTLTGLTNGTTYDITVTAAQDSADPPATLGVQSEVVQVIPGRPSAPTNIAASAGNAQVNVTWHAVDDVTGITVTDYTLAATTGATTVTASVTTSACSGATCSGTITGLTNGTTYAVKVAASSVDGSGPYGTSVDSTPRTTPSAPQSLAVTVLDGGLDLAWAAPSSTGGAALDTYTIAVTSGASTVYSATIDAEFETDTVSGLANGTAYSVSVTAANAAGAGPAATSSSTPLGPPSAPQSLVLTPSATNFSASWAAPASDGGSAVTSYTVTVIDPQENVTELTTAGSGTCLTSSRTCTVSTVDAGNGDGTTTAISVDTAYSVSVVATNAQGDSTATTAVTVIPGQPSPPRNVVATSGNESFEVCLDTPATIPAPPITGYRIRTSTDGEDFTSKVTAAADWSTSSPTCTGGKKAYTLADLGSGSAPVNGTEYTVLVSATTSTSSDSDDWAYGMDSTATTVTPMTTPGPVTSLAAAVNGSGSILATWAAPSSTGGSPITAHQLRYLPAGGSWVTHSSSLGASAASESVTGLTAGTSYSIEVTAINVVGSGTSSTTTITAITTPAPAVITSPAAGTTSTTRVVEYGYVTSASAPVDTASIIAVPTSGSTVTYTVTLGSECSLGSCQTTVSNLAAGSTYDITVRLGNDAGTSDTTVAAISIPAASSGGSDGSGGSSGGGAGAGTSPPSDSSGPGADTQAPGDEADPRQDPQDSTEEEQCLLRSLCSGWDSGDGTVLDDDGSPVAPIDDTSRWPDLPTGGAQPVTGQVDTLPVEVTLPQADAVDLDWQAAATAANAGKPGGSTAGYLLQLRRVGASKWTTFEVASPSAMVDLASRGYVYEARVLRNSDFALVASTARFGVPLRARESITMSGRLLAAQLPQATVLTDPAAQGGSLLLLEGLSTMAQLRTSGDRLTIWYPTGPGLGMADVLVDGVKRATLDQRADAASSERISVKGLGAGRHTIAIIVTKGPRVGLDAVSTSATCAAGCQASPRGVLPTPRGGVPAASGPQAAASLAFVAPRSLAAISAPGRSTVLYLDGKPLAWNDKRVVHAGNTVALRKLTGRPHMLTVVPLLEGTKVLQGKALGRLAKP